MNIFCWVAQTNSISTLGRQQQVAFFLILPDKGSRATFRSGMRIEQNWDAGVRPVCAFGCVTYFVLTLIYRFKILPTNSQNVIEVQGESSSKSPRILNRGLIYMWRVSYTPWPPLPLGMRRSWIGDLGGRHSEHGCTGNWMAVSQSGCVRVWVTELEYMWWKLNGQHSQCGYG